MGLINSLIENTVFSPPPASFVILQTSYYEKPLNTNFVVISCLPQLR